MTSTCRLSDHRTAGPPRNPDAIQLYSLPTPNGVKVSIALEEMGLPYDAHLVGLRRRTTRCPRNSCR